MPPFERHRTQYPGVFYIVAKAATGRPEKVFYILYRNREGKLVEEKAGRQFKDAMTAARAATLRSQRIAGQPSNREKREARKAEEGAKAERWTISRLWGAYKEARPGLKGLLTDENRFAKHIKTPLGDKEPQDIAPFDVDRLRLSLLKTKKPATVRNVLELLRRIVNFGVARQLCSGFTFKLELPRVNNLKTEDLTPDQLAALLKAIDAEENVQVANLMRLALLTGMRRGELFRLKWEHIDVDRGFILLADPKGGQDQKIPLSEGARRVLEGHPRTKSPYVFPGRDGGQRVDIIKQVNRVKAKAGLPKEFRALHGLRHAFASMLASSGEVDLFTLQKLLTHKSPTMTQRYAHLRDEVLKRASGVADRLLTDVAEGQDQEAEEAAESARHE
jgi:integrase